MIAKRCGISFWENKNVLQLIVVFSRLWEYIELCYLHGQIIWYVTSLNGIVKMVLLLTNVWPWASCLTFLCLPLEWLYIRSLQNQISWTMSPAENTTRFNSQKGLASAVSRETIFKTFSLKPYFSRMSPPSFPSFLCLPSLSRWELTTMTQGPFQENMENPPILAKHPSWFSRLTDSSQEILTFLLLTMHFRFSFPPLKNKYVYNITLRGNVYEDA